MSDPLSEVVRLLRPRAMLANVISGRGDWAVRYSEFGLPSFCIVLEGNSLLAVDGHEPISISAGDFILLPTTPAFTISSFAPALPVHLDPHSIAGRTAELRYGDRHGPADMRSIGGAFHFDCANPGMLVALLPRLIHVRGSTRLAQLVQMVGEESAEGMPGGEYMLTRLAEMLLIEAMRVSATGDAPPGLLRGLGDERLARALNLLHAQIEKTWTVTQLAEAAALSRSTFFERFTQVLGVPPMDYLLRWRMEIAKELLRDGEHSMSAIAERVGYGSASAFSVAFSRQVGQTPSQYARSVMRKHGDGHSAWGGYLAAGKNMP